MLCPNCGLDKRSVREVHTGVAIVYLECGHRGMRNPDIGMALEWDYMDVMDSNIGAIVRRKVATKIDKRELVLLPEDKLPVEETPEINTSILKEEGEEDPSEEELIIELEPVVEDTTPKKRTKTA